MSNYSLITIIIFFIDIMIMHNIFYRLLLKKILKPKKKVILTGVLSIITGYISTMLIAISPILIFETSNKNEGLINLPLTILGVYVVSNLTYLYLIAILIYLIFLFITFRPNKPNL
ncbi:hypothetical protein C3952_10070 [Lactococcus lactis]|nr:hypothetical protein C3952_10070 [Lactococcus lactis]